MTQSKVPGPNLGSVTITGTVTEKQDQQAAVATTWTSVTSVNTTTASYAVTGYGTINVGVLVPTTTTAGAVTIEGTQNGTDWAPLGAARQDSALPENPVALAYNPATNGFRVYAASVEAFTQVRVKLTTVIAGAGNVIVTITGVAGGIEPVIAQRSRKVPTYRAVYRATARIYNLSNAMGANSRKQFATIHHPAAATKTVRLRSVAVMLYGNSVSSNLEFGLMRVSTAPATGNPAITPCAADSFDAAAEATCLALPTTAATEGAMWAQQSCSLGATGAIPTTNPPPILPRFELLRSAVGDDEAKLPTIRAGVLEGWAVTLDSDGASTVQAKVEIEFTEEPA